MDLEVVSPGLSDFEDEILGVPARERAVGHARLQNVLRIPGAKIHGLPARVAHFE